MPVEPRSAASSATSPMGTGALPGASGTTAVAGAGDASSSTSVPHASHVGQRPIQRGDAEPHSLQRWTVLVFEAMVGTLREGCDTIEDVNDGLVVGFDLDMTLVDSRPGIVATLEALRAETGAPVVIMTSELESDRDLKPLIRLHPPLWPEEHADAHELLAHMLEVHEPYLVKWPELYDIPLSHWGFPPDTDGAAS